MRILVNPLRNDINFYTSLVYLQNKNAPRFAKHFVLLFIIDSFCLAGVCICK